VRCCQPVDCGWLLLLALDQLPVGVVVQQVRGLASCAAAEGGCTAALISHRIAAADKRERVTYFIQLVEEACAMHGPC